MTLENHSYTSVEAQRAIQAHLAAQATLPPPGSGVIVSDEDLLASLKRDGATIGDDIDTHPTNHITPMQIALAWIVGAAGGGAVAVILFCVFWKLAKAFGLVA